MRSETVKVKVLDSLGLEHDLCKFSQKLCLKCLCHVGVLERFDHQVRGHAYGIAEREFGQVSSGTTLTS